MKEKKINKFKNNVENVHPGKLKQETNRCTQNQLGCSPVTRNHWFKTLETSSKLFFIISWSGLRTELSIIYMEIAIWMAPQSLYISNSYLHVTNMVPEGGMSECHWSFK